MHLSLSEENYLKAIFKLREKKAEKITTNAIASALKSSPASVTDMVQKLHEKRLLNYARYQGVSLTPIGKKSAVSVIRKHRLWELFLVSKLGFQWDEVHEIAEQLEHIQSEELVRKLYSYLGKPKWDPHGDPIPDEKGNFHIHKAIPLSQAILHSKYVVSGVLDHSADFLQYLDKIGISISQKILVRSITEYDRSMEVICGTSKKTKHISSGVSGNLLVIPVNKIR